MDRWLEAAREYPLAPGIIAPEPRTPTKRDLETDGRVVQVVARVLPPFVSYEELTYRGLSIEVLEAIAADRNWELEITGVNSTARLLDDLQRGVADIAVAALAITADREREVDFSHPYLSSGLQILMRSDAPQQRGLLAATLGTLAQFQRVVPILLSFLLVTLIAAHLIWLIERHRNPEFPVQYIRGVFAGLWWAVVTVTTVGYGDKTPKASMGKIVAIFWVLAGYFVFAYFTAAVTSSVTVSRMRSAIDGPEDLYRVRVGVVQDSVALDELRRRGIRPQQRPTIEQLLADLASGELEAIVHHAPFLQHYAHHHGSGNYAVVGSVFGEIQYGFAVPEMSPLRQPLNRSLLDMMEDGRFNAIASRWL